VFPWPFVADGTTVSLVPKYQLCFSHSDTMIRAAEAGGGILMLQEYLVRESLKHGRLVNIMKSFTSVGGPIWIIYPPGPYLPARVRTLVDFLVDRLG
jgi:DNA-binding transcriptional LysR family regulator